MDKPYRCGICHENFRLEEFALRCEAQGIPELLYQIGDVVSRKSGRLSVIDISVHHGLGSCPVDGPCEHAATYNAYDLIPDKFDSKQAWIEVLGSSSRIEPGLEVVVHLNGNWGIISKEHGPEDYMRSPDAEEEWDRLWELYDSIKEARKKPINIELLLKPDEPLPDLVPN